MKKYTKKKFNYKNKTKRKIDNLKKVNAGKNSTLFNRFSLLNTFSKFSHVPDSKYLNKDIDDTNPNNYAFSIKKGKDLPKQTNKIVPI